ncbi:MAG TPA: alpha/beta hydrolase [Bacteriovoracaceae bacterium]|nr:alpha/beta hydrolase [Bacteriovoracaceae bacterium]
MNLVCIHGNSLSGTIFDDIDVKGFNKIVIELPGHGKTELGSVNSFFDLVQYVKEKVEGLSDVVLLGSSLGGHIAHHLLESFAPLGVVTISAPPLNLASAAEAFLPNPLGHLLFQVDITKDEAHSLAESMLTLRKDRTSLLSDLIIATDPKVRKIIGASFMKGEFLDEKALLTNFQGMKAFIIPTYDQIINQQYIKSQNLGRIFEVKGNHILTWDNPDAVNLILSGLLAEFRK